jgi:DNA polymerase-4
VWHRTETEDRGLSHGDALQAPARGHAVGGADVFRVAEPLLAREADGRTFRMIGVGAYDLVAGGRDTQAQLFEAGPGDGNLDEVLDGLRDRFGDDAVVRGRGFGVRLARQGPSKVE